MLQLAELYSPISTDLEIAERAFQDELISDQAFISDLCQHVARFHGKRLRPALLLLTARACGELVPAHHTLAAVVEMVHIATLVHDDVLDEADIRRRAATVNRLWGNERAVLMGDFLISHAFHLCSSLESQAASRVIGDTTNTVCEGEMMQVVNRGNLDLTESVYLEIITRKTASLIGACCQLGARFAGADQATVRGMKQFGIALGVAFQIVDDVLDLVGDEAEVGKSLRRDLEEGKLTLPLIHCMTNGNPAAAKRLRNLLDQASAECDAEVVRLLRQTESLEYARQVAGSFLTQAQATLDLLPESESRDSLSAMTEFVLIRQR